MIRFAFVLSLFITWASAAMAGPIIAAIPALLAGGGILGAITQVVIGIGLSLIASVISGLFVEKPKVNPVGIQTEQTTTGDTTPYKFAVGVYGLEGHLVAPSMSHGHLNSWLNYVLDVSNIPVNGFGSNRIAIDGQWYEVDFTPGAESPDGYGFPIRGLEYGAIEHAWLNFYAGNQPAADPMLVDRYSAYPDRPWTTDHVLKGSAYAVLTFRYNREIYNGLPAVRFEIRGIDLYDPRKDDTVGGSGTHRWADKSTWEFTDNPQVIAYNIFRGIELPTGDIWGGGVPAEDLPLDNWFAAMNACDALIGARTAYTCGFEISVDTEPFEVIQQLNKASFARNAEFGGKFTVRVGAPAAPSFAFTDDDVVITQGSSFDPFPGLEQTYNAANGVYVEPTDVYAGKAIETITNAQWEAEDGGRRLFLEVNMPAVTRNSQAKHLLNSYLQDARRMRTHRVALPPWHASVEPLDSCTWTSEYNGYTNKVFEVVAVTDLPSMVQLVQLRERDANDVNWNPTDDPPEVEDNTRPIDPNAVVPTLTVTPKTLEDDAGNARKPALQIQWPEDEATGIDLLRFEVRVQGTETEATDGVVSANRLSTIVSAVTPNTPYEVRAQYLARYASNFSDWTPVTTPDVRIHRRDVNDDLQEEFDYSRRLIDGTVEEIDGVVGDLRDLTDAAIGPIRRQLDFEIPRFFDRDEALDQISETIQDAMLRLRDLESRTTQAGLVVDPENGRIYLLASGLTGEAQQVIDGINGEIALRTTFSDVSEAIALANFDPSQVADLEDLFLRLSAAEIAISAQEGAIVLLTESLTVDGTLITMGDVQLDLNSLDAKFSLYVTQTEFSETEERLTVVEEEVSALGGASIRTILRDVSNLGEAIDITDYDSLEALIDAYRNRKILRSAISFVQQDSWARADANSEATAGIRNQIGVLFEETETRIREESKVRASGDEALALVTVGLQSQINNAEKGQEANATAIEGLVTRVDTTDDGLVALASRTLVLEASTTDANLVKEGRFSYGDFTGWGGEGNQPDSLSIVQRGAPGGTALVQNAPAPRILRMANDQSTQRVVADHMFEVREGDKLFITADMGATVLSTDNQMQLRLQFFDADKALIESNFFTQDPAVAGTWRTYTSAEFEAPANASFGQIAVGRVGGGTGLMYVTNIRAERSSANLLDANASISTLESVKVDAEGAVGAVNTEIRAKTGNELDDIEALASTTLYASATADEIITGYVLKLDQGGTGLEIISVSDGEEIQSAAKLKAQHILLDGDTQVNGDFQVVGVNIVLDGDTTITGGLQVPTANITGVLNANQIKIDGVTLDTDGEGNLIINDGGVGRDQIGLGGVAEIIAAGTDGPYTPSVQFQWVTAHTITLEDVGRWESWQVSATCYLRAQFANNELNVGQARLQMRAQRTSSVDYSEWGTVDDEQQIVLPQNNNSWTPTTMTLAWNLPAHRVQFRIQVFSVTGATPPVHSDPYVVAKRVVDPGV